MNTIQVTLDPTKPGHDLLTLDTILGMSDQYPVYLSDGQRIIRTKRGAYEFWFIGGKLTYWDRMQRIVAKHPYIYIIMPSIGIKFTLYKFTFTILPTE